MSEINKLNIDKEPIGNTKNFTERPKTPSGPFILGEPCLLPDGVRPSNCGDANIIEAPKTPNINSGQRSR